MHKEASIREPLVLGDVTYSQVSDEILAFIEKKPTKGWKILMAIASIIAVWGVISILYLLSTGIGVWGLNKTIGWAWDITNFVWWVGIGHAGTLISAVLLLFRQKWRMAINRPAEAMTIFAVFMAGTYPLIHMGRLWNGYWVFPLPNEFGSLWVNFNSPLLWDVFAISTYMSVSLVFWYIGLIPDFATIRDRAKKPVSKIMYGILSFGWTGNAKAWQRFEEVSLVLAGLATPLVFSVHSIVSMDFATSVIPGWHTTIFPPYFVAGAVFSGFAMVQTLMLIVRKVMKLERYVTIKHIEYMNIVIIVTGSIVGVAYLTELFISWYSGVEYESYAFINRFSGKYAWAYWTMMTCNVISPQLFWVRNWRRNLTFTFIMSIVVNIGMWFERFVIIVTSLHRDYLPSSWSMFYPSWTDISIFLGTIGIFGVFYLLFLKYFPVLALNEIKTILRSSGEAYKNETAAQLSVKHNYVLDADSQVEEPVKEDINVADIEAVVESQPVVEEIVDPIVLSSEEENIVSEDPDRRDDLTKIEGIGPKIKSLFYEIEIYTFAKLSTTHIDVIHEMLDNAGPRYRMHKAPAFSWAEQAKLASEDKWEELKTLQDKLDGGK